MKSLNEQLSDIKVVPVIAIKDAGKAVKLAEVLIENGLPCAEITFRTEQAAQAIKNIREVYPDMLIGAGTILTTEQVDQAIESGVDFIVSPGFNPVTVKYCQQRGVPIVPGVNNPSLVEQAMEMGLKTLKFFPAEPSGGTAMLKSLAAVYPVKFMPTGGVSPKNVKDYLSLSSVLACGGTWMVPNDLIDNEKWEQLAQLVSEVTTVLK
ncbi:bifunctional 4-hydroxy-2-oxoglutarate aldolase/2-dehydro-3-deoxy-phosphogluconate aldolase [Vibrio vulnificus]|nr:bifunctional 4-hydroxy-2-oxoglutarate aldolase/2-dehydro-3-deoxy-phosphogluconate aldolase [Vibrio vulnificus]EIA1334979.1 bifunctional 4-hydroxy-2-oxoglutarate aldolase/2-dehydro-3-deoxy-phosphogluconate aldolase [Vibrio vulnificus]EIA1770858.1 bifunctional 4-hydroxy-2-oxoglutarate aldolase/2-dehydro-3-deoxy-phosphogluconate aldolase [Vibrio vulnificus]EIU7593923.1 bifunctional 4-hydroxy-2-oxoglutarate aldolase/2-dehydro-3-deoxy-phosphogluconate aldolase [Vibrio vulnificus]EIX4867837.1 bifu